MEEVRKLSRQLDDSSILISMPIDQRPNNSVIIQNLPKHTKYFNSYKPNDLFHGLGVEHETYLESTSNTRKILEKDILSRQYPERYSVNYFKSYKPPALQSSISKYFNDIAKIDNSGIPYISIPILLNSHAFQNTDIYNQPVKTYEKNPKPNPKFCGQTMHEYILEKSEWFRDNFEKIYLFDGDTIEFTTLNFYKASVCDVIKELSEQHEEFLINFNSIQWPLESLIESIMPLQIQKKNYPFASYTTNLNNISMFNNGTIHINITLPTLLDSNANIANRPVFIKRHQTFARLIQWLEPFLICVYGTPDPFCKVGEKYMFGGSSQRLAVSRYIGIGTYDTTKMSVGKILQVPRKSLPWAINENEGGWYPDDDTWAYEPLSDIGLDINFNKHRNHGLELRFFDAMPMKTLEEVLEFIVNLGKYVEMVSDSDEIPVPQHDSVWKKITLGSFREGKTYLISKEEFRHVLSIFVGFNVKSIPASEDFITIKYGFQKLRDALFEKMLAKNTVNVHHNVEETSYSICCNCFGMRIFS